MPACRPSTFPVAFMLVLAFAQPVRAEVKSATPESLQLAFAERIEAPPSAVWAKLGDVGRWWSDDHTYSGKAANLSLATKAGACFCEQWTGGTVEHGRVILALNDRLLRLEAPLGPLQGRAVTARLTFELKASGSGTDLAVTYLVSGSPASALDRLAPGVDGVLGEAVRRFRRYAETGRPTE